MIFIILFYIGAIGITFMLIAKARSLKRAESIDGIHHENVWFAIHPESVNQALHTAKNEYFKPAIKITLLTGRMIYRTTTTRATGYLRKKFYNLLHYSMHREMGHGVSDFMRDITHHRKTARARKEE